MSELEEKVKKSMERLKTFQPKDEPYHLAFSGGKDSVVCKALLTGGVFRLRRYIA